MKEETCSSDQTTNPETKIPVVLAFFLSIQTLKQKSALARQIEKRANFVKQIEYVDLDIEFLI